MKASTNKRDLVQPYTIVRKPHNEATPIIFLKLFLLLFASFFMLAFTAAHAQHPFNNVNKDGVILDGYDAVAFFTDNKPVKGSQQFQYTYGGAIYYFASKEHQNLFTSDPEKYKPQFGAWCAYAVSLGRTAPIDVNTFSIVNNRLVVQHNQRAVNGWNKDIQGNLMKADTYWPRVENNRGKQITTDEERKFLNNTDKEGIVLQGYDAVAYFTQKSAIMGNARFEARYNGATYWFSSEENASLFKDHPENYVPQYGAFCGYAMSLGKLRPIDPSIFQIYNGKLILQHSRDAYEQFNKNLPENVGKADANWPEQIKKHAGKKIKFDKPANSPSADITSAN